MSRERPAERERSAEAEPRLAVSVLRGPRSGSRVRDALDDLVADADPVALEQIAVLIGALTSSEDGQGGRLARVDLKLWTDPSVVRVELRDRQFSLHRSQGGLVESTAWSAVAALKLVERLADRWSVTHDDDELTLGFEFDRDRSGGSPQSARESGERMPALRSEGRLRSSAAGSGSIPGTAERGMGLPVARLENHRWRWTTAPSRASTRGAPGRRVVSRRGCSCAGPRPG